MMKLIGYVGIPLVIFTCAATGSWLYFSQPDPPSETTDVRQFAPPVDEAKQSEETQASLSVPITGRSLTAEEIFRFGATIRERQEAVKRREAELEKQQLRLKLIQKDIESEQRALEGMLTQLRDAATNGQDAVLRLQEERALLENEKQQLQQQSQQLDTKAADMNQDASTNLKKLAPLLQGMQPEKAADTLKQLINDGEMDAAIQMLRGVEERNASKMLDAMESDVLTELLKAWKQSPRTASK